MKGWHNCIMTDAEIRELSQTEGVIAHSLEKTYPKLKFEQTEHNTIVIERDYYGKKFYYSVVVKELEKKGA